MKRIVTIVAAGLMSAGLSAHAQTPPAGGLRMDSGLYIGAGLGGADVRDFCSQVSGACDKKDGTWNVFAGYQVNRYFAVEAGYSDFGSASTSGITGGGAGVTIREKTKAFELVAVGMLPIGQHFSVYGKVGGYRYDSDGSASGAFSTTASDKGTELTFGVGAQYDFDGRIAVRAEAQRYYDAGSGLLGKSDIRVVRASARYKF